MCIKKNEEKNARARERYKKTLKDKKCNVCSKEFIGTLKSTTCSKECTRVSKLNGMKVFYHIKSCKYCGEEILRKEKFGTKSKEKKIIGICKSCSEKRKALRKSGELYRPRKTNKKRGVKKEKIKKFPNKEDYLKYLKDVGNRIGRDEEIKVKRINTVREKISKGEIKFKTGKDHHLWKGNRNNNQCIRTRLKDWRKKILKENNYKCSSCGCNKKLEIHHVEPLREIIDKFTKKPLSEYKQGTDEFENLSNVVVEYHNNNENIGIVLCEICHSEVDSYRKQTLKNENKRNKKK